VGELLHPDGTLNLTTGWSGSLNLSGYSVTLDAERGPVFTALTETWSPVGEGLNGACHALLVLNDTLIAGGSFTNVGALPVNYIASWNGIRWSALRGGLNGPVYALTLRGTDVVAGGNFTRSGTAVLNRIAVWSPSMRTWTALGTGLNSACYALQVQGSDLFAGGTFTVAGNVAANFIARWSGTAWFALGVGLDAPCYALASFSGAMIAGGAFTTAGNVPANRIARWSGTAWTALGAGLNGTCYAMTVQENNFAYLSGGLFVGGDFSTAGGIPANNIARWNGTTWFVLGSGLNGPCYALAANGSYVYAGGAFTSAGGQPANRIARWSNPVWSSLGEGLNGDVYALAMRGTTVVTGGLFTEADREPALNIAVTVGCIPPALAPLRNDTVCEGDVYEGKLFNAQPPGTVTYWGNDNGRTGMAPWGMDSISPFVGLTPLAISNVQATPYSEAMYAYVNNGSNLAVVNLTNQNIVRNIPIPGTITAVAVSPANSTVLVTTQGSGTRNVVNIDTRTHLIRSSTPVGTTTASVPTGIAINGNGSRAYITNRTTNNVTVFDPVINVTYANIPVGTGPRGIAVSSDSSTIYVASEGSNEVHVLSGNFNTVLDTIPVGESPYAVLVHPNNQLVYVTIANPPSIDIIDVAVDTVVANIPLANPPRDMAISRDGSRLYVSTTSPSGVSALAVINTLTSAVIANVAVGPNAVGVSISPDGTLVGVASSGTGSVLPSLRVISTATNTEVRRVDFPAGAATSAFGEFIMPGSCAGSARTFSLQVYPRTVVNLGKDTFVCAGRPVQLTAEGTGVSFLWTPPYTLSPPHLTRSIPVRPAVTTDYIVEALNAYGCPARDTITVKVHKPRPMICRDKFPVYLDSLGRFILRPGLFIGDTILTPEIYQYTVRTQSGRFINDTLTCDQLDQIVTVTLRDPCSNQQCQSQVIVLDTVPPKPQCSDVFVRCALTSYDPFYLRDSFQVANAYPATDNCGAFIGSWTDGPIISRPCSLTVLDQARRTRFISASFVRTWSFRDSSGNRSSCTQNIYFERVRVWDVTFPRDTSVRCDWTEDQYNDENFAPFIRLNGKRIPLFFNNPVVQFCGPSATYTEQVFPEKDGVFTIHRRWVIADPCLGNVSGTTPVPYTNPRFAVQIITVTPDRGITAECPANLTVSTRWDTCCVAVDLPDIILSDACGRPSSVGAIVRAIDFASGDTIGTYGIQGKLVDFPNNNHWLTDTLGALGKTPCLPPGTHLVTYNLQNDRLALFQCRFTVTVANLNPPSAICQDPVVVALGQDDESDCYFAKPDSLRFGGVGWLPAGSLSDGSYDRCHADLKLTARRVPPYSPFIESLSKQPCIPGGLSEYERATAELDSVKFYCEEAGSTIMVSLRVYRLDYNGQPQRDHNGDFIYGECMTRVQVQDKLPPTCTAPPSITIDCESFDPGLTAYGDATIQDNCCIGQISRMADYSLFDTVCNKGTLTRFFEAQDCSQRSVQCAQRIVVNYKQSYFVRFPDDRIITHCAGNAPVTPPLFFGKDCEALGHSYKDDTLLNTTEACRVIRRTWRIINWCTYSPNLPYIEIPNPQPQVFLLHPDNLPGPVVSAAGTLPPWSPTISRLSPQNNTPLAFSTLWSADANGYSYTQLLYIVDQGVPTASCGKVDSCDYTINDSLLWKDVRFYERHTQHHDLCEGPVVLSATATDACAGGDLKVHFRLFLDLDDNGIAETMVGSQAPPAPGKVHFGNALNPNYQDGIPQDFDARPLPPEKKYRFAIQTTRSGDTLSAALRWNTVAAPDQWLVPELPHGTHRIEWIFTDGCGNETLCKRIFTVKDCKKPTIVCKSLNVNLSNLGTLALWPSDFLEYAFDNCTPADSIHFKVVNETKSTGRFPGDSTILLFTCADVGVHLINIWGKDYAGNADFCATYVIVQDNAGACTQRATIAGTLTTEAVKGVQDAKIQLSGKHFAIPPVDLFRQSDDTGNYVFSNALPYLGSYEVKPYKNDNPLNGVTTLDLSLISKHILNLTPLTSPYKLIAADANKSGTITTLDIVALRRLILGISDSLTGNTSWRFVPRTHVFPNPRNPFQSPFPESIRVDSLLAGRNTLEENFVSIKTGDLNGTAQANNLMTAEERSENPLYLSLSDHLFEAGEFFRVKITAPPAAVFQFTLEHPGLLLNRVEPVLPMRLEHFGVFEQANFLTVAYEGSLQPSTPAFVLHFKALHTGSLKNALFLSDRPTKRVGFNEKISAEEKPKLSFKPVSEQVADEVPFRLYTCVPNPFQNRVHVTFYMPRADLLSLHLGDATGRLLMQKDIYFEQGMHTLILVESDLVGLTAGVYWLRLNTAGATATLKLVRQ
jgi:YVTN family beta-propeller protein